MLARTYVGTDADKNYWYTCDQRWHRQGRDIGKTGLILSVGKTF